MTREEIRTKHGIAMIEHPSTANKELTDSEAKEYEDFVIALKKCMEDSFARKPKEDRLIELVKLYASELTDKQLEHSLAFFEKLDRESI